MNATINKMLSAYGQTHVDIEVATASPHKLIAMLYEGALVSIANAKVKLAQGDISGRGNAISRAIAIIEQGLKASVDIEAGGELSHNLVSLYEYMTLRLLEANLKVDVAALEEVERLLRDLKGAWDSIGTHAEPAATTEPKQEPPKVAASYGKV